MRSFSRRRTNSDRRLIIGATAFLMLGLSGALAVVFFALQGGTVEGMEPKPEKTAFSLASVKVLIPIRDIEVNQPLDGSLFRGEERPVQYVSPRVVRSLEQIKGQTARTFVAAGEPLLATHLTGSHASSPLSQTLCETCRAVTIRVNDLSSINGLIMPGEKVDVAWIHNVNGISTLTRIVQAAKVIARDEKFAGDWKPGMSIPGTITLETAVKDAETILLAQANGILNLTLRPRNGGPDLPIGPSITVPGIGGGEQGQRPLQHCNGKMRICSGNKQCEWMCIKEDGSLEPVINESAGRI